MRTKKLLLITALVLILLSTLSACGLISSGDKTFDTFSITISGAKERYLATDTPTILIVETKGSPTGYNVYDKFDEGDYVQRGSTSLNKSIPMSFSDLGTYYIKIVPVVGTLEQAAKMIEQSFLVVENTDVPVEKILVKSNVIDLYYGESDDNFALSNLQVVYTPTGATNKNLSYINYSNPNIQIQQGVVSAIGYTAGQQPYVLPIYSNENNNAKANVYFRINNSRTKSAITKFHAGYVDKDYYNNDWVGFQCFAYAGMNEAEGYAVYRKVGDNYTKLISNGGELQVVTEQGIIFHKVQVTEPEGRMNLRFFAIIGGVESSIYTDVSVELAEPTVVATSIALNHTEKTLLLDQSFVVEHTILPVNTYDKTVRYEIEEGFEDYLVITPSGEVSVATNYESLTPLSQPITLKVISNSSETVFEEIEITVIGINETDIEIGITAAAGFSGSNPLIQTIGTLYNINFEIIGLSNYSSKWYLNNIAQPASSSAFALSFNPVETAGTMKVKVEITFEDDFGAPLYTVAREFTVTLESVFEIDALLDEDYQINEEIELGYTSSLSPTSVLWSIYTASGSFISDITGSTYLLEVAGNYKFRAIISYDGTPIEEKFSGVINVVESISHEMHNVYTNGYNDGANYAPHIKWFKLGEDTDFTVEIRMGTQTITYESSNAAYSANFSADGFKVPYDDFKLSDSFEYRIKTSISNRYTGFYNYQATISPSQYSYLNDLDGITNRYILNVYDLGKVLNYLQVFRPSATYNDSTLKYIVSVDLYFAINYETDVNKEAYGGEIIPNFETTPSDNVINASKLITAANKGYGAGIGMVISYIDITANGGVALGLTLPVEDNITLTKIQGTKENIIIYNQSYSDSPRGIGNTVFPIDSNLKSISVTTSNQLFLAASWGMKPIPTTGSAAERIYNEAKAILNRIIDDSMTDMEKAHAIFDYLASEIDYDNALYDDYLSRINEPGINEEMRAYKSFHLEGVFDEGVAVCDGISKAFTLLCAIEDIPAIKLSGVAQNNGGSPINHAWNMIMLEGKWYYVDATWGRWKWDYNGANPEYYVAVRHFYMKATDDQLQSHQHDGEAPIAASDKLYYYYTSEADLYFSSETELTAFISNVISLATEDTYYEFIIDYDYPTSPSIVTLEDYVSSKLTAYSRVVTSKDNVLMIIIFA